MARPEKDPDVEASKGKGSDTAASDDTGDDITTPVASAPVSHGFKNIERGENSVSAEFEYGYTAPDRSEVHITAGPADTTGDGDRDGLSDAAEAMHGTRTSSYDSDRDGLADGVEVQIGTDPLDRLGDADKDGVVDSVEIGFGTNPFEPDTDHDGIGDAAELDRHSLLAIVPSVGSTDEDWDGDGIPNDIEEMYGRNKSIPEESVPEFKAQADRDYELRLQLRSDPVQQAMVAADLRRELTPEQEGALLDAVFDRGIATDDVFSRYSLAGQMAVIDGTPVPAELEAEYQQAVAAREQGWLDGLEGATLAGTLGVERQIQLSGSADPRLQAAVDARLAAIGGLAGQVVATGDPLAMLQLQVALPGVTITPELLTGISTYSGRGGTSSGAGSGAIDSTGPSATGSTSGSYAANPADAALDRVGDGFGGGSGPTSPPSPSQPPTPVPGATSTQLGSGTGETSGSFLDSPTKPTEAGSSFVPDSTPTKVADAVGNLADQYATQPSTTTGTSSGPVGVVTGNDDELTITPVVPEGQPVVNEETGWTGTLVTNDDGTQTIYLADGGRVKPSDLWKPAEQPTDSSGGSDGSSSTDTTDAGDSDDTDDTTDADDTDDADGTDDTGYVNPDADPVVISLSPVVAQIIAGGVDPTTTTPSGPYVDDSPTPLVVTTGTADIGLGLSVHPGVIDGNPETAEPIFSEPPGGLDPEGPDIVDPTDPVIGVGGEDINPGEFTPRPSVAFTGLMGDGPPDDGMGFDPDPFG